MINQKITDLKSESESIDIMAHGFFKNAPILYSQHSPQLIGVSNYKWGNLDETLRMLQDSLLTKYDGWFSASKELVDRYSSDRSESFIDSYVSARKWIELKVDIWINEKEKNYQYFRHHFKVQMDIISSLEKIIEMKKSIEDSEKTNASLINDPNRIKDLEEQLANGTKNVKVNIQNIAQASSKTGDISIEVKNEVIIQAIKPTLDNELKI